MKKLILLLYLLAAGVVGFGQSRIIIDEYLVQRREHNDISYQWTINGVTFTLDAAEVTVYPHREGLDTIFFQETVNRRTFYDTIFTRLPDRTTLVMTIGCCDDGFDIIRKADGDNFSQLCADESLDADSCYRIYLDSLQYGTLKFEIMNKPATDTLVCLFNQGGLLFGQMITVEKDYGWVTPCKFGYTDNVIPINIRKKSKSMVLVPVEDDDLDCFRGTDIMGFHGDEPWEKNIKSFSVRTFNKENVVIRYDYATDDLQLQFF